MAPVVVEVDALPQSLVLLRTARRPAPPPPRPKAQKGVAFAPRLAHIADTGLRRVGLRCGQQMVVLRRAGQIRFREILQQRIGLRSDPRTRNNVRDSIGDELLEVVGS